MWYIATKILITACIIVCIAKIAEANTFLAALLASLPIISVLSLSWLYIDTGDTERVSQLSYEILWLVIPSLVFFVALPMFIKFRLGFYLSLLLACLVTGITYIAFIALLKRSGIVS